MEIKSKDEIRCNNFFRKQLKRMIAVTLSLLMVASVMDYSGFIVNAEEPSDTRSVTAIEEFPENIGSQQITVGSSETDINMPNSMCVTIAYDVQNNARAVGSDEATQQDLTENDTNGSTQDDSVIDTQSGELTTQQTVETITLENITWNINATQSSSDIFDSSIAGATYIYEPVLSEGYILAEGVSLPKIQVQIKADEDSIENKEVGILEAPVEQIASNEVEALTSTPGDEIASVTISDGATPVNYTDFATALSVAQSNSGSTLTLLADVDRGDQTIVVASGKTMTIDTNGHTLSFYLGDDEKGISVEEGATFTLRGNSSESATVRGTPAMKSTTKSWGFWTILIYAKGTCTIESAYLEGNEGASRGVVMEGGSLTVNNSTIKGGGFSINNKNGEVNFDGLTTLEGDLYLKGRATVNAGASMTANMTPSGLFYFNTFCVNGTIGGNFTWNPGIPTDSKLITTVFTANDIQITDSAGNSFPMTYTGNAIETKVFTKTITDRNGVTKEVMVDTDTYTQTFEKQGTDSNWSEVTEVKDAGAYRVKYESGGSIITKEFMVERNDLSGANIALSLPDDGYTYDSAEKTPGVTVTKDGKTVDANQYDISYSNTNGGNGNHTNAGTVTVTITGKNNYTGTASTTFSIDKKTLVVKADDKQNIVAGTAMPQFTYSVTGLVNGDTFTGPTISATADTNTVGEHEIRISGGILTNAENYEVTYINAKLTVVKIGIEGAVISGIIDQNYNGNAIEQSGLSVQVNGKTLTKDIDYTVTYKNNIEIGIATVTITGNGIYTGTIEKNFQINSPTPISVSATGLSLSQNSADLKAGDTVSLVATIMPADTSNKGVTFSSSDTQIATVDESGTVTGKGIGIVTITATSKSNSAVSASCSIHVSIGKVASLTAVKNKTTSITLSWDEQSNVAGYQIYRYNSSKKKYEKIATIKKDSTTTYTDKKRSSATNYNYKVRAYVKVGKKTKYGRYSNILKTATQSSKPILNVKAGSKKATITWDKVKDVSGYEIYMSTSKKTGFTEIKSLTSKKTKYTKKKLTKGTNYYFKIRTYKKVDGVKIYSSYSKVKKVKVK